MEEWEHFLLSLGVARTLFVLGADRGRVCGVCGRGGITRFGSGNPVHRENHSTVYWGERRHSPMDSHTPVPRISTFALRSA